MIVIGFNNSDYNEKLYKNEEVQVDYRCVNIEKNRNIIKKFIKNYELL